MEDARSIKSNSDEAMPTFEDGFWGMTLNGFDVLQTEIKNAPNAAKELVEYMKARAAAEDAYAKTLIKLAKTHLSTTDAEAVYAPTVSLLCARTEDLATQHLKLGNDLLDLAKRIPNVADPSKFFASTKDLRVPDAATQLQISSRSMLKARRQYLAIGQEYSKLPKGDKAAKKLQTKMQQAAEEYSSAVTRYNEDRTAYVASMQKAVGFSEATMRDQVDKVRGILLQVIEMEEAMFKAEDAICDQSHKQVDILNVDRLLETFVVRRGTGSRRPAVKSFEEFDPAKHGNANISDPMDVPHEHTADAGGPHVRRAFTMRLGTKKPSNHDDKPTIINGNLAPAGGLPPIIPPAGVNVEDEDGYKDAPDLSDQYRGGGGGAPQKFSDDSDDEWPQDNKPKIMVRIRKDGEEKPSTPVEVAIPKIGGVALPPPGGRRGRAGVASSTFPDQQQSATQSGELAAAPASGSIEIPVPTPPSTNKLEFPMPPILRPPSAISNTPAVAKEPSRRVSDMFQVDDGGQAVDAVVPKPVAAPMPAATHITCSIAVTETLNAFFRGPRLAKCEVHGDILCNFPAATLAAIASMNGDIGGIKLSDATSLKNYAPNFSLVDQSKYNEAEGLLPFNAQALSELLRLANGLSVSVSVLKYQVDNTSVHFMPLRLCSTLTQSGADTILTVHYQVNKEMYLCVEDVSIVAIMEGSVTSCEASHNGQWKESTPQTIYWNLETLDETTCPTGRGKVQAKFKTPEGGLKLARCQVKFLNENVTVSSLKIDCVDRLQRDRYVERVTSGKYLSATEE